MTLKIEPGKQYKWPSSRLRSAIRTMVGDAKHTYYANDKDALR